LIDARHVADGTSLAIDAQYLHSGQTRYVEEGALTIEQSGASFTPTECGARFVVLQVGLSFGTGGNRPKPRQTLASASKEAEATPGPPGIHQ